MSEASEMWKMANAVHGKVCEAFPMFVANGWRYRGFTPEEIGGIGPVVILRFEKSLRGRFAYIEITIGERSFNDDKFDFKEFISWSLQENETLLVLERESQLDNKSVH